MRCLLFRLLLPALSPKLETPLSDQVSSVNITGRLMQYLLWKLRIPKIKDVLTLCKKALGRKALTQDLLAGARRDAQQNFSPSLSIWLEIGLAA